MTDIANAVWVRLESLLLAYATKLKKAEGSLITQVGHSSNDAFLLRGYLSCLRHPNSDEVAITVDIRSQAQQVLIESDVCAADGRILVTGPSASILQSDDGAKGADGVDGWLREFEQFLSDCEATVVTAVANLS